MADLQEVAALLHVHEKASAHGDLLRNIANEAMAKLRIINDEHGKPQESEPVFEADPQAGAPSHEQEGDDDDQ